MTMAKQVKASKTSKIKSITKKKFKKNVIQDNQLLFSRPSSVKATEEEKSTKAKYLVQKTAHRLD